MCLTYLDSVLVEEPEFVKSLLCATNESIILVPQCYQTERFVPIRFTFLSELGNVRVTFGQNWMTGVEMRDNVLLNLGRLFTQNIGSHWMQRPKNSFIASGPCREERVLRRLDLEGVAAVVAATYERLGGARYRRFLHHHRIFRTAGLESVAVTSRRF